MTGKLTIKSAQEFFKGTLLAGYSKSDADSSGYSTSVVLDSKSSTILRYLGFDIVGYSGCPS